MLPGASLTGKGHLVPTLVYDVVPGLLGPVGTSCTGYGRVAPPTEPFGDPPPAFPSFRHATAPSLFSCL